jgi:phosphoribosylformylglycinamidine synthase
VRFAEVRAQLKTVLEAIERGLVQACHDISEGGLVVAAAEMALPSALGLRVRVDALPSGARADEFLFSETAGFLLEVAPEQREAVISLCRSRGAAVAEVGQVKAGRGFEVVVEGEERVSLDLHHLEPAWRGGLKEAWS